MSTDVASGADTGARHEVERGLRPWASPDGLVALAGAVGGALATVVLTAPFGPSVQTDSVSYLTSARALGDLGLPEGYDGLAMTKRPPLYPAVLALADLVVPGGLVDAARVVNALCVALVVLGTWMLLRLLVTDTVVRVAGTVAVAAATTLVRLGTLVLAEALFTALLVMWSVVVVRTRHHGGRAGPVAAGALAGALVLTRLPGVAIVAATVIWYLVRDRVDPTPADGPTRRGVVDAAWSMAASAVVGSIWVALSFASGGEVAGGYEEAYYSLATFLRDNLDMVSLWLVPAQAPRVVREVAFLAAMSVVVVLVVRSRSARAAVAPLALAATGYVGFSVVASLRANVGIEWRTFAPILPLVLVVITVAVSVATPDGRWRHRLAVAMGVYLVLLAAVSTSDLRAVREGGAFTGPDWRASELASLVQQDGCRVAFSNEAAALAFFCGGPVRLSPERPQDVADFRADLTRSGPVLVAWFPDGNAAVPPDQWDGITAETVVDGEDGSILRVSAG